MATKTPSRDTVIGMGRRLAALYEADALDHLEEGEFVAGLRQLHVEARKAGIDLSDPEHPVQHVLETIYDVGDEDHARELLANIQAMELADRRQLAKATAQVERERFQEAAGEILHRSGTDTDEFRSAAFRNLSANVEQEGTLEGNIEVVREMDRQIRATATTIEHSDIKAAIMDALPRSARSDPISASKRSRAT